MRDPDDDDDRDDYDDWDADLNEDYDDEDDGDYDDDPPFDLSFEDSQPMKPGREAAWNRRAIKRIKRAQIRWRRFCDHVRKKNGRAKLTEICDGENIPF